LSAGRMVGARAPARRRRRDHRERARDDPRGARCALARVPRPCVAVVRTAGDRRDRAGGDGVLPGRTERTGSMTSRPAVFLGADAGGSHSSVVVGSPAQVLGRADGPGAAMRPGGAAASAAILADTARRAAAQAGIPLPGNAAVLRAASAQDGRGEGSTLLARLLAALGLQQFDDLVRWTATATPAQVAALAPHVLNAAREGEVVAQRAVDDAARELVELVVMLSRHF